MNRPLALALLLAALLLAAFVSGCAVADGQDRYGHAAAAPPAQDPARVGLAPEYRVFFDDLRDEGDWAYVEPFGWCFHPRVNWSAWRPYQEGWWEPSDVYGWVWNSDEPFGWICYHYGTWFYDEYQGWLWQPGPVWGPAWVAWVGVGDYVGWAPLAPVQYHDWDRVPGGLFTFAPAATIASSHLGEQSCFVDRLPTLRADVVPIGGVAHVGGVAFNRGPDIAALRRMGQAPATNADLDAVRRVKLPPHTLSDDDLAARTRRLVAAGKHQVVVFRDQGKRPPAVSAQPRPRLKPAARDNSQARKGEGEGEPGRGDAKYKPAAADSVLIKK